MSENNPQEIPASAIPMIDAGQVWYFMVPTAEHEHAFTGTIYEVTGSDPENGNAPTEWEEVGEIFLKWDGCAHVGFRSPSMQKNWVHVCGEAQFDRSLKMLRWAWDTAKARITSWDRASAEG